MGILTTYQLSIIIIILLFLPSFTTAAQPAAPSSQEKNTLYYWIDPISGVPHVSTMPPACHFARQLYPPSYTCPFVYKYDEQGLLILDDGEGSGEKAIIIKAIQQRRENTFALQQQAAEQKRLQEEMDKKRAIIEDLIQRKIITWDMTRSEVQRAWGNPVSTHADETEDKIQETWEYPNGEWVQFIDGQVKGFKGKAVELQPDFAQQ